MEGPVCNPAEITVENNKQENHNMKKQNVGGGTGYEINQVKEAQHHTQYIVKPPVQENNYIIKDISYTPNYFIQAVHPKLKDI